MLDRKIRYCSLPEAIRDHFLWGARSIVVAGTHGKTTTTAMAGWLLVHAGLDPSVLVGGIAANLGQGGASYRLGRGRDFVIEGDEYDSAYFDKTAKFLKYLPDVAVVGNVEFDHADIYPDLDAVLLAFRRFVNLLPRRGLLLVGADSTHARGLAGLARSRVETFGLGDEAKFLGTDAHCAYRGLAIDAVGWAGVDGMLTTQPSRWWNETSDVVELANTLIQENHSGQAAGIEDSGIGYIGSIHQLYAFYQVLQKAVEDVGAKNFDGQAFYDTAISFTTAWDGYEEWGFTATKRYTWNGTGIYEWSAQQQDIVRKVPDWLALVLD